MDISEKKLLMQMPSEESFITVAGLFKLFDDNTRLRIFWILYHMEACILQLSGMLGLSSPAISHHIRLLKEQDLLMFRKDGKEVYYRASDSELCQLLHLAIENVMQSACPITESAPQDAYMEEIHRYLLERLDKRITIDTLSRQFLLNPTTLKERFKHAYGHSLATHIRIHRMETASQLLTATNLSVQEIAGRVGYTSQSKFSAAFRHAYGFLPLEYRKKYR